MASDWTPSWLPFPVLFTLIHTSFILLPTGQLNPTTEGDQHGANSILLMLETKTSLGKSTKLVMTYISII